VQWIFGQLAAFLSNASSRNLSFWGMAIRSSRYSKSSANWELLRLKLGLGLKSCLISREASQDGRNRT